MPRPAPPACCRCCDNAARARFTLARVLERGEDPTEWWCARPDDVCSCPQQTNPADRCSCRHCLSWLRRAPRCARADCTAYAGWTELCRAHDQERRNRRAVAARKAAKLRRPPRPTATAGACTLCGTSPLPPRRRSWCSAECVEIWEWASTPAAATAHLVELHGAACWACDATDRPLELEHIRPLWSLTDEERLELRWWLPFNLQLLCTVCHKAKSAREAAQRASRRGTVASPTMGDA